MLSFILGVVGKFLIWTAELVFGAVIEGFIFGQEVIIITKKKKKKPAMTKKNTSPSKKQRKKMSQSSGGGTSSKDYLSPGAKGTIINSGGPK